MVHENSFFSRLKRTIYDLQHVKAERTVVHKACYIQKVE